MKSMRRILSFILIIFFSIINLHAGTDLPVFYRTPFFQGEPKWKARAWSTSFGVRYGQAQTSDSWNGNGNKKPLLSVYGPTDITKLGTGLTEPITAALWGAAGNFGPALIPGGSNGKINFTGRLRENEATVEFRQQAIYGFFAQAVMPIRQVNIDRIDYANLGAADVNAQNIPVFFTTNLNPILAEQGMKNWNQSFSKTAIPDVDLTVGWQGYAAIGSSLIADIGGNVQGGVLLPCSGQRDDSYLGSIPMGYNKELGFVARGSGEAGVFDWLAAGVYGSATIFLSSTQTLRLKNHEAQSGCFFLKKGCVKVEPGTVWNVGGYIRGGGLTNGLSLILGASYTRQEQTDLSIRDSSFNVYVKEAGVYVEKTSDGDKNTVINSDLRWRGWGLYTLHMAVRFALGDHKALVAPACQLEYNYPIEGKLVFKNPSYAGTVGLHVNFGF